MFARDFFFAANISVFVVYRRVRVAADADFGAQPHRGVGVLDRDAVFHPHPGRRPVHAAEVDDLAEVGDPTEVDGALRHALTEDLKAGDRALERDGLVALAAAGAALVEGFLVGEGQLAAVAEEAGVLAGNVYLDGGVEVGADIGDHFLEEISAAPIDSRFGVIADRDIEGGDHI